jgi:signal transduction histidine kinase
MLGKTRTFYMQSCLKLLLRTQKIGLKNSQIFPSELTKELVNSLELIACSFYTISANLDNLILRGQNGFQYEDYISFELPVNTIAGVAYKDKNILFENDLENSNQYRDKLLISKHSLTEMIAIPLFIQEEKDNCVGVVCLYPSSKSKNNFINNIHELQDSISLAYTHSIERTKIQVREKVVSAIAKSNDLTSALHRVLQVLKTDINIEAGSIYLYEEKYRLLRLYATTGISTEDNLFKHDIVFKRTDSGFIIWDSFIDSKKISISNLKKLLKTDKYIEETRSKIFSVLAIPILKLGKKGSDRFTIGVMKVINKLLIHNEHFEIISFTQEDVDILSYISEIIGLSAHMFLNSSNRISYFEKIMHGTKSNIQASIQNLEFLEQHGNLKKVLKSELLFTISDTKDWLYDIKNQMDRLSTLHSTELEIEKVYLTGDILFNIKRLFEKTIESCEVSEAKFSNLDANGFFYLPPVMVNQRAITTVFRNLVENAIKYRDYEDDRCIIKLTYDKEGPYVNIYFTDYGIGIPKGDGQDIFDEGFRSENAIRQDPSGTGLGLTQSKELMKLMGGNLTLESISPVILKVQLKKA